MCVHVRVCVSHSLHVFLALRLLVHERADPLETKFSLDCNIAGAETNAARRTHAARMNGGAWSVNVHTDPSDTMASVGSTTSNAAMLTAASSTNQGEDCEVPNVVHVFPGNTASNATMVTAASSTNQGGSCGVLFAGMLRLCKHTISQHTQVLAHTGPAVQAHKHTLSLIAHLLLFSRRCRHTQPCTRYNHDPRRPSPRS